MNRYSRFTLTVVALASALACSKDPLRSSDNPKGEDMRPVRLELQSPASVSLGFVQFADIKVKAVFADDGSPVRDRQINFVATGNPGGSTLTGASLVTDVNGTVQNRVTAGNSRTSFTIVVSTQNAAEVSVQIVVDGTYKGSLRVQYSYSEVIPLHDLTTRIHANAPACSSINLSNPPANAGVKVAASSTGHVLFENLNEGAIYTVTVSALGPGGNVVATGCKTAAAIPSGGTTTVTVPLDLGAPEFVGVYDFSTKLHTNEALPGELGQTIALIDRYLQDPANALAQDLYAEAAAEGISQNAIDFALIFGGIDDDDDDDMYLDDMLEAQVFTRLPQWMQDGITIGADVTNLMTNLTVGGSFEIKTASAAGAADTYDLTGRWEWHDFLFRWRLNQGCSMNDGCCGREQFSGEQLGIVPVGADFSGSAARDRGVTTHLEFDLNVPSHRLDLQYGKLVLALLNHVVFPSIAGQNSFACTMEALMGCDGPGTFVCGGASTGVCGCATVGAWLSDSTNGFISESIGTSICQVALLAAESEIEDRLEALTYNGDDDTYFMADIVGLISDSDKDLQTDVVDAGNVASLYVDASANPVPTSFTGDMFAEIERTACTSDAACSAGNSCQVRRDVLDDCEGRTVCVPRVGPGAAGQACTQGSQCGTGVCIGATSTVQGKCFATCGSDSDCPGSMSCGIDAVDVSIGTAVSVSVNACGM